MRCCASASLALLSTVVCAVEPSITAVAGAAEDGRTIIITGSGFGAKSPVAPLKFDNFENGAAGDYLLAHDALWQSYQGDRQGLVYDGTQPHAGALALGRRNGNGENFITNYFTYAPGSQELFVSYWWKVVPINPGSTIIKMTRLNSSPEAGGGGVYNGAGNTSLGGTFDLGTNSGPYCAYNNGAEAEVPITGSWSTAYFDAPPNNTWFKVDSYKKLSTPGTADGAIHYRLSTQEKGDARAMTRAAGQSFLLDTVLLGTMDGSPADHDYWIYIDDVYIDTTQARVEISASPRWADRVHGEMQLPHTQWNDGQLQVTVNRGAYATGTTVYLYVVNMDGIANAMGFPIVLDGVAPPNTAPVVSAAAATPSPATGTTASLSATASDDAGEAALTYTWSAIGPEAVAFSPNETNAAKLSTATFTRAGAYVLTVSARDDGGLTATRTVNLTVSATPTTLAVSPASATVSAGATVGFAAVVSDQFGRALASQPAAIWTVSGGGTISSGGVFAAGATAGGPHTVTATAGGRSGTAQVTVTTEPNQAPVAVAQSVNVVADTATAITLSGSDADGDALTYAIVSDPAHGTLSGGGASWTYTPAAGYAGSDSFTFTVHDGQVGSAAATVSIQVAGGGGSGSSGSSSGGSAGGGCGAGGAIGLLSACMCLMRLRKRS